MGEADLKPEFLVKDEAELRGLFPETHAITIQKGLGSLDAHAGAFIARAPFL